MTFSMKMFTLCLKKRLRNNGRICLFLHKVTNLHISFNDTLPYYDIGCYQTLIYREE